MRGAMEHCDFTGMEQFRQGSWSLVMKGVMETCDDKGMEHCDDNGM